MPITQIPFQDPIAPPEKSAPEQLGLYDSQEWETAYRDLDARVPHLLVQLQDDLARSRRREAAWISIIVHLMLFMLLVYLPWIEKTVWHRRVGIPVDPRQNQNMTFLALPPDLEKPMRKPNTNIASDKDRIAMSKHPELDPKESRRLVSPPPGAPGMRAPRNPQPAPPQQAMNQPPMQQPQQAAPQSSPRPQFQTNQTAQLQMPAQPKNSFSKYAGGMTAGSAIQQATQDVAANHGTGGEGGDFGLNSGAHGRQLGNLEILSDTQNVDFGPYLQRLLVDVKQNWYLLIPPSAEMKKGKLAIKFAIAPDGHVMNLTLVTSSGDVALDRPAWGSITNSNPFSPLPTNFKGPYLELLFRFYYNPDKADLE
jgi:outer membrane biosynthesis protein TonB